MCRFANFRLDVLELKAPWVLELTYSIFVVERLMAMAMEEKMFNSLKVCILYREINGYGYGREDV